MNVLTKKCCRFSIVENGQIVRSQISSYADAYNLVWSMEGKPGTTRQIFGDPGDGSMLHLTTITM